MKKKLVWLVVGSLVTLSLLLSACAPKAPTVPTTPTAPAAPTTPTAPTTPIVPTAPATEKVAPGKVMIKDAVGNLKEKPRFGGTLTVAARVPLPGIDRWILGSSLDDFWNEEVAVVDWTKGKAGTGETHIIHADDNTRRLDRLVPRAASWEIVDPITVIMRLKPGIRFHVKPGSPASGREMTAEDLAWSTYQNYNLPTSYICQTFFRQEEKPQNIQVLDRYTVKFNSANPRVLRELLGIILILNPIYPKDAYQYYGNFNDWRNAHGAGPFIITDLVPGASYTLSKNPNYYRKQPLYPEDTIPYIDTFKYLVIPDKATMLAAFRARKIDCIYDLVWEDLKQLQKTTPDLKYGEEISYSAPAIGMVVDNPKLPWYDKKVRHALQMAINREDIKNYFYQGKAEIYAHPVPPMPSLKEAYVPMEKLPESVQDYFKYQPQKAKQMLAEAGYPKGFKVKIVTRQIDVDLVQLIQAYWKDVGVDLEIQVKEPAVWNSIQVARNVEEMFMHTVFVGGPTMWAGYPYSDTHNSNTPRWAEKVNRDYMEAVQAAMWKWEDLAKVYQQYTPILLDFAAFVIPPDPYLYKVWQPWLRDYNGEERLSFAATYDWAYHIWIDQDLKQSLTGRK